MFRVYTMFFSWDLNIPKLSVVEEIGDANPHVHVYTLYNAILRIARNFLETKENIKISTHPFYHVNLD